MEVLVNTYRGPLQDMMHTGHIAVVDYTGKLLYSCGDPERVCYARSSAKPMQAMCVLESGAVEKYGLDDQDIALFCASHNGEPMHIQAVRRALGKAGLTESVLQCGVHYPLYEPEADRMKAAGEQPSQIHCNCSGKHSGMLITAAAMGEDLDTYYKPEHPVQQRILHMIGEICEYDPQKIIMGTDGCGVPVHALPLCQFAYGVARMAHPESLGEKMGAEAARITAAMGKYPLIMSGTGRIDAQLMEKYDRLFCKSGADGYYIVGDKKEGIGIAVKIDSGNGQARNAVVVEVLRQLGIISQEDLAEFADTHTPKMRNHKQEEVGSMRPEFTLHKA